MAHTIQGQVTQLSGKRIAKHMSQVAGSWLLGVHDNDKSVSRTAQDSFKAAFPSEEKYRNFWRVYQPDIVKLVLDVTGLESPTTLSDERTTSSDDANTKYFRTLGAAIMVVTHMISRQMQAEVHE